MRTRPQDASDDRTRAAGSFARVSAGATVCVALVVVVGAVLRPTDSVSVPNTVQFADVPEEEQAGYQVLHQLEIPAEGPGYHQQPPPYTIDRSAELGDRFDRVAYHLALEGRGFAGTRTLWVSMAAFTDTLRHLGLPVLSTGAVFQRAVQELHVYGSETDLPRGAKLGAGAIEFWPHNYTPINERRVPGADDSAYDHGDLPVDPREGYGSLQVHHPDSATVLFAWNGWGSTGASDLGIGTSRMGHADWTFAQNAGDYARRTLTILVRPTTPLSSTSSITSTLQLFAPRAHAVHQRDGANRARVPIVGRASAGGLTAQARAHPLAPDGSPADPATPWRTLALAPDGHIRDALVLDAGWYAVEVGLFASTDRETTGDPLVTRRIGPVGVGEVFISAGQSNSANHGMPQSEPRDRRVTAGGLDGWRPAWDPQPVATGDGGSPWPAFADRIAAELDVPVGLVSVGWGGTQVSQWLPNGTLYPRLRDAIEALRPNGARAVLWHQGESDAQGGTASDDYARRLAVIIAASRDDAGFALPWGVARGGFMPGIVPEWIAAVVSGQDAVIAADPAVFAGPPTDDLVGAAWRHDTVHFNAAGLDEHGERWARHVLGWLRDGGRLPGGAPTALPPPD